MHYGMNCANRRGPQERRGDKEMPIIAESLKASPDIKGDALVIDAVMVVTPRALSQSVVSNEVIEMPDITGESLKGA